MLPCLFAGDHRPGRRLSNEEHALEISIQHRVPVFFLHIDEVSLARDTRVVNDDVRRSGDII